MARLDAAVYRELYLRDEAIPMVVVALAMLDEVGATILQALFERRSVVAHGDYA